MGEEFDLSGHNYVYVGRRWIYPYIVYLFQKQYSRTSKEFPTIAGQIATFHKGFGSFYWIMNEDIYKKAFDKYKDRLDDIEKHIKSNIEESERVLVANDVSAFQKFFYYLFENFRAPSFLRLLDAHIYRELKKKLSDSEISLLSTSTEQSILAQEEIELLKHATGNGNTLEGIHDKFACSTMGYYDEKPRSMKYYEDFVSKIKDAEKRLDEIQRKHKETLRKRDELFEKQTSSIQEMVKIYQRSVYLKDLNKYRVNKLMYLMLPKWNLLAEKTGLKKEQLLQMFPDEIQDLIDGKKLDIDELRKRNKHMLIVGDTERFEIYTGKIANEKEKILLQNLQEDTFKGRIACSGVAEGTVKVVKGQKDFSKFMKGDILVVVGTTPDYMPVLSKAAGIISEEGGVTSHVSIVARELNIPAIVGISNATSKYKDGQKVKVDADKGEIVLQ